MTAPEADRFQIWGHPPGATQSLGILQVMVPDMIPLGGIRGRRRPRLGCPGWGHGPIPGLGWLGSGHGYVTLITFLEAQGAPPGESGAEALDAANRLY